MYNLHERLFYIVNGYCHDKNILNIIDCSEFVEYTLLKRF